MVIVTKGLPVSVMAAMPRGRPRDTSSELNGGATPRTRSATTPVAAVPVRSLVSMSMRGRGPREVRKVTVHVCPPRLSAVTVRVTATCPTASS